MKKLLTNNLFLMYFALIITLIFNFILKFYQLGTNDDHIVTLIVGIIAGQHVQIATTPEN